ncbi:MAG: hypothetical protein ABII26_07295 [Pseudomonadota bacterium]
MTKRISPLNMEMQPDQVIVRDSWEIALTYLGEKKYNPHFIADLSHVPKWILQWHDLDSIQPAGLPMPARPREVTLEQGILIIRLTPGECRIMALGHESPECDGPQYTEVTDAFAALAVVGPQCMEILNKLGSVDLDRPGQAVPCAAQAPIAEVPCLITRLHGQENIPGLIVTGVRGYGHFLLKVFLDAGKEFGLSAAGWNRFKTWLAI